ncbi:stress response RCI peptide [Metarhizium guizhouense ARSEF 977]|uniref:Stress response RCI peptide n=1 Tax=Metarhizium guizhouense (strain ARSEF 977) TaxID=1276136 RepID=A0A0B4HEE1_METGA|nr:stress response RCI peptide [Metarhizium guizhouense ARSEF 977]
MCSADIFLALLAVLFPPLPVWVKCGICSADSIINILLCCLGFIPGLIHAWYIIAKYPEPAYEYESLPQEGGHVTYVYVQTPHGPQCRPPAPNGGMNYGTQQNGSNRNQQQPQPQPQGSQQPRAQTGAASAESASSQHGGVPPSYAEVVAGDHKVQSQD